MAMANNGDAGGVALTNNIMSLYNGAMGMDINFDANEPMEEGDFEDYSVDYAEVDQERMGMSLLSHPPETTEEESLPSSAVAPQREGNTPSVLQNVGTTALSPFVSSESHTPTSLGQNLSSEYVYGTALTLQSEGQTSRRSHLSGESSTTSSEQNPSSRLGFQHKGIVERMQQLLPNPYQDLAMPSQILASPSSSASPPRELSDGYLDISASPQREPSPLRGPTALSPQLDFSSQSAPPSEGMNQVLASPSQPDGFLNTTLSFGQNGPYTSSQASEGHGPTDISGHTSGETPTQLVDTQTFESGMTSQDDADALASQLGLAEYHDSPLIFSDHDRSFTDLSQTAMGTGTQESLSSSAQTCITQKAVEPSADSQMTKEPTDISPSVEMEDASDNSCSSTEDEFDVDDMDADIYPNELSLSNLPIKFKENSWKCKICTKEVKDMDVLLTHVMMNHTEDSDNRRALIPNPALSNSCMLKRQKSVNRPAAVPQSNRMEVNQDMNSDKTSPAITEKLPNEGSRFSIEKMINQTSEKAKEKSNANDKDVNKNSKCSDENALGPNDDCFIDLTEDDPVEKQNQEPEIKTDTNKSSAGIFIDLTDDLDEPAPDVAPKDQQILPEPPLVTQDTIATLQKALLSQARNLSAISARSSFVPMNTSSNIVASGAPSQPIPTLCTFTKESGNGALAKSIGVSQKTSSISSNPERSSSRTLLTDFEKDDYKCSHCGLSVNSVQSLFEHVKSHLNSPKTKGVSSSKVQAYHQCNECWASFRQIENYKDHMAKHTGIKRRYKCGICKRVLSTAVGLRNHMTKTHAISEEPQKVYAQKQPHVQGQNGGSNAYNEDKAPKIITPQGQVVHKKTTKSAVVKNSSSMLNTPQGSSRSYECGYCREIFVDKIILSMHVREHRESHAQVTNQQNNNNMQIKAPQKASIDKPTPNNPSPSQPNKAGKPTSYKCGYCGKTLYDKLAFKEHYNLHRNIRIETIEKLGLIPETGENVEDSDGSTEQNTEADEDDSWDEDLSDEGKKKFQCKECGKKLKSKKWLATHMKSHSHERPFPCPVCRKMFKRALDVNRHIKVHLVR